jgi:hypothetical protein
MPENKVKKKREKEIRSMRRILEKYDRKLKWTVREGN